MYNIIHSYIIFLIQAFLQAIYMLLFFLSIITSSHSAQIELNKQMKEEDDLHEVSSEYPYRSVYYLTNTKYGIVSSTDKDNLQLIKLIYPITTTKTSNEYSITVGEVDKTSSLFYFSRTKIEEINKIEGCVVEQKEYKYDELDELCDSVKSLRNEIINSYELPTWFKRDDEFYSGHLSNGQATRNMNIEEIEYKLGCGVKTYSYASNEIFSLMNDDNEMLIPDGILSISRENNGKTLRVSKENYTFVQRDTYSELIDRYGRKYSYGICLTQDCKYMCISEEGNLGEVYGSSCFKKQNKQESINNGLELIDYLFSNYLKEVDTFSSTFIPKSKRLLLNNNIKENNNEKGYYYEDVDESLYYKAYLITPTSFIQIHQKIISGRYYQMKMVKTLASDENSFTISSKTDYDQSESGFEYENSQDSTCNGFVNLVDVVTKCPSEKYDDAIPIGSYSFTTTKLTVDNSEYTLKEMDLAQMTELMNKITIHKIDIPNDKFISYYNKKITDEEDYYFEELEYILYYNDKSILWRTDDDYPVFSYKFQLNDPTSEKLFYSREGIEGYYRNDYNRYYDKFIGSSVSPFEDPTKFDELIQQYKTNITNIQNDFKKYLEIFIEDDNPATTATETTTTIETTTTTDTTTSADDDNKSESPTTHKEEEIFKITMILSNLTESDLNEVDAIAKAIKNVIIKIYKTVDITIPEHSISINKIEEKTRLLDNSNTLKFEIIIKIPNDISLERINDIIESKTTDSIKTELIEENSEIFQHVQLEIDIEYNNKSNTSEMSILLLYIAILLLTMI